MVKINCGINKRKYPKRRIYIHKNIKLEINGEWEDKDFHKKVIKKVKEEYPGWMITGYAFPETIKIGVGHTKEIK